MKIITIASLKGGVGKTTIAVNLAQALATLGHKVLAVDLDPNNNLTDFFLRDENAGTIDAGNALHWVTKRRAVSDCIFPGLFVHCLPATIALHSAGLELSGNPGRLLGLKPGMKKLPYDYAVIDSPPAMTFEFRAALYCADLVLTPIAPARWIAQAVQLLQGELEQVEEATGTRPELRPVPSMVTAAQAASLKGSEAGFQGLSMTTAITRAAAVRSAIDKGKRLNEKGKSWAEFVGLAGEIV